MTTNSTPALFVCVVVIACRRLEVFDERRRCSALVLRSKRRAADEESCWAVVMDVFAHSSVAPATRGAVRVGPPSARRTFTGHGQRGLV